MKNFETTKRNEGVAGENGNRNKNKEGSDRRNFGVVSLVWVSHSLVLALGSPLF